MNASTPMLESRFSWILAQARRDYAARMPWQVFSRRYLSQENAFVACDPAELLEYWVSPEYQEIQALLRRLAMRQDRTDAKPGAAAPRALTRKKAPQAAPVRLDCSS